MSYLLTEPEAVLLVGESGDAAAVRSALTDGAEAEVVTVPSAADVRDSLSDRADVGCVVSLLADPGAVDDVVAAVRATDYGGRLPVVVYAGDGDTAGALATAVAAHEGCRYLPGSAEPATLRAVVDDALAAYADRRREHAESGLFTTLLTDGEFSIFAKDTEGRHVYKSAMGDDEPPEKLIGKTDVEALSEAVREQARASYEDDLRVVETGEPIYDRIEGFQYPGSNEHWSMTTKVPWRENGEIRGLVGFARDVTTRKRYERRLEEQSDRIDQFVSYVSHDLRTPLQIAHGGVEQTRMGEEADGLDRVERALERIEDIVDDLASLSKGGESSGIASETLQTLRAESLTTEVGPLVRELWSVVAPDAATLDVALPAGTVVTADVEALRPVLENLLNNAVEHAGPAVSVTVGATDSRGLYVADDGPGIPESDREKVLQPGYTTASDGTGTGLDIVAETVTQEGWELSVDESADGGARFVIEGVPMAIPTDAFDLSAASRVPLAENADVGPVAVPGDAEYDEATDRWRVVGDGGNVWGDTHEFHYVYGRAEPPVRLEGRLVGLDGVEEFSKAGFAVRAGLDPEAPFGYVGATESHGSEVTWRLAEDGFTDSDQFEEHPGTFPWYALEYVDGVLTCFLSEDGEEWVAVDQRALDLGAPVTPGLLVCSHSRDETCEATFADVRAYELDDEG